jgi:GGDEF domain-containing protein
MPTTFTPPSSPAPAPPLVVVGRRAGELAGGHPAFADWDGYEAAQLEPLGFFVAAETPDEAATLAARIRRSRWWDRPVYLPPGQPLSPLIDGAMELPHALSAAQRMLAVRQSLRIDPQSLRGEERLLHYLYVREPSELQPVCDRGAKLLYRYPAAEALAEAGDNVDAWLTGLTRRGLLAPATLLDRTRHCRQCGSAHLHFLDVCPHCSSLQIRKSSSLHCFTCGHVAPEADFRDEQGLACPKCSTRLRHIGVDYDRPLTQYACASCHHAFVEAGIVTRCLDCDAVADPSTLDVREVAPLRLTPHGRAALRAGQIEESFAALDLPNNVVLNYFRHLVDWALAAQQRHPEFSFGLVLIEFEDAAGLIESMGAPRAYLLLDEFARRLHELLRTSDVTTRTSEQRLWVFLPFSSPEGFAARVRRVLQEQAGQGREELKVRVRHLRAPEQVARGEQAAQLMHRLQEAHKP